MDSTSGSSADPSATKVAGDSQIEDMENVKTNERVPANPHYYEKNGLRTYGDDEDHDHEPPVSLGPG